MSDLQKRVLRDVRREWSRSPFNRSFNRNQRMGIVVKKFGGTSVGDIARIKNVAGIIRRYKEENPEDNVVAVVSAMAGETNKLVGLARACASNPAPREMDVVMATGEQVTIGLLAITLIEEGVSARSLMGQQARISTDCHFNNAQILKIDTSTVLDVLNSNAVPVVAGFQGVDNNGNVTTLGRGGSDITAVALAAALGAKACYIYTDVDGVYTADPRICKTASRLSAVSHEEMLEMASLGAKVLHPRSVYFAMRYSIPMVVLSSFQAGDGTWVVKEEELMEKPLVSGVTYRLDEARINIYMMPGGSQALTEVFSSLGGRGIFVDMITQVGVRDGLTNLSFTVPDESSSEALEVCQDIAHRRKGQGASLDRNVAKVSVVGVGMRYHTGVAAKMFQILANENIEVDMISTSEIKISVIIPRKYCEVAVRALHEGFVELGAAEISVED